MTLQKPIPAIKDWEQSASKVLIAGVWKLTVSEYQSVVRKGHSTYVFKASFKSKDFYHMYYKVYA